MNTSFLKRRASSVLPIIVLIVLYQTGCAPTYPKEIVDRAVIQLCKEEYSLDVKVKVLKSTIAVFLPLENLLDEKLSITKEASEKINDVILGVSRVTLSTDAPIDFYIVIGQDPELTKVEVVIIRYVKDIRMLHYSQISRGEFGNRALIELKLTPQAQKEQLLRSIFSRFNVEETQELMDEFLSKDVNTIGDIGYWSNKFFIKDVNMEEFLALQIAGRARRRLMNDESELKDGVKINLIKGRFVEKQGKRNFEFDIDAVASGEMALFMNDEDLDLIFDAVFDEAAIVLHGYKYNDFHALKAIDKVSGESLILTNSELENLRKKRIKIGDLRHGKDGADPQRLW